MSRSRTDAPHTLILGPPTEDPADRDWRVVHPPTCPWDAYRCSQTIFADDPLHDGREWAFMRACITEHEITNIGLDSLDPDTLPEGRHRFVGFADYCPGDFGGDYGAEWDVGLYLLEPQSEGTP